MRKNVLWLDEVRIQDKDEVGGKNASLGEMMSQLSPLGIRIPQGFATTASAFNYFLEMNNLKQQIQTILSHLVDTNIENLAHIRRQIQELILMAPFDDGFIKDVTAAYEKLQNEFGENLAVAVRSSATAEDLFNASFAGQQETYLNVVGLDNVLISIKRVFASLYNDRAITYRNHHGISGDRIAISVGVQRMVRSDLAVSGVMFSVDTETRFKDVVFINASYGLGEMIVQGGVNPDEFYVYKPSLSNGKDVILRRRLGLKTNKMIYAKPEEEERIVVTPVAIKEQLQFCIADQEIENLAKYAVMIENHYGYPVDIEWAKDGNDGQLYIVQARAETVQSRLSQQVIEHYKLMDVGKVICKGRSVGQKIGVGRARVLKSVQEISRIQPGDVLVTDMTDPDWEPIMKTAAAIVTNRGGRTCHAAIIARELGIPAVVGCEDATIKIPNDSDITVSCAEGETGFIYEGLIPFDIHQTNLDQMPALPFKMMLNVGNPERAFAFHALPNHGVGLARLEFIISQMIGIHPNALLDFDGLTAEIKHKIAMKIAAYDNPVEYYIERLKEGIAMIAAPFFPKMVIVRLSDFKSNEYRNLLGGDRYEPLEQNPMLGFRGAGRYISEKFRPCFELECKAIRRVREDMGLTNVAIMVPFVRTVEEGKQVIDLLAKNGLQSGKDNLKIIMMCEVPSNALLAEEFLKYYDGFSIGSNDLTQLTLGLDRDSEVVASIFDERNPAVKTLLHLAIQACKKQNKYIGICGQGPSDLPDLAKWLMDEGIESISLNPDTVVDTWLFLGKKM